MAARRAFHAPIAMLDTTTRAVTKHIPGRAQCVPTHELRCAFILKSKIAKCFDKHTHLNAAQQELVHVVTSRRIFRVEAEQFYAHGLDIFQRLDEWVAFGVLSGACELRVEHGRTVRVANGVDRYYGTLPLLQFVPMRLFPAVDVLQVRDDMLCIHRDQRLKVRSRHRAPDKKKGQIRFDSALRVHAGVDVRVGFRANDEVGLRWVVVPFVQEYDFPAEAFVPNAMAQPFHGRVGKRFTRLRQITLWKKVQRKVGDRCVVVQRPDQLHHSITNHGKLGIEVAIIHPGFLRRLLNGDQTAVYGAATSIIAQPFERMDALRAGRGVDDIAG